MGSLLRPPPLMTFDEFVAFVEERPIWEKWELIDGEPIMSPSANFPHQIVTGNLVGLLRARQLRGDVTWYAIPGIGLPIEGGKPRAPIPDVAVMRDPPTPVSWRSDALAVFEVLSKRTKRRDLGWKRENYPGLPVLDHYVIVWPEEVRVAAYDRENGWRERSFRSLDDRVRLDRIDAELPLAEIYRWTDVAGGR